MYTTLRTLSLLVALAAAVVVTAGAGSAQDKEEGFKDLFNGKDFTGLKFEVGKSDPTKTWSVKDGAIICTGKPSGYFYTDKSYKNYILKFDWRYERPKGLEDDEKFGGNSGCLIHCQETDKIWPKSVEVQGQNSSHGNFIFIKTKGADVKFDSKALKMARKKVGEWNTTEIEAKPDGVVLVKVNGTPVSSAKGELTEGPIAWQSEGAEIHFKNLKIKELK